MVRLKRLGCAVAAAAAVVDGTPTTSRRRPLAFGSSSAGRLPERHVQKSWGGYSGGRRTFQHRVVMPPAKRSHDHGTVSRESWSQPRTAMAAERSGGEQPPVFAGRDKEELKFARPRRRRPERHGVWDSVVGVAVTSAIVVLVSFGHTDASFASYAPSSAAVNSQLPARKLDLEELETLNPKKALQRERALGRISVSDLLVELDDRLETLQSQVAELENILSTSPSPAEDADASTLSELKKRLVEQRADFERRRAEIMKELAQKRKFEAELKKRAEVLRLLEEQPSWVNYVAAAAASVVSTLAMHPVDTIKTRLQAGDNLAEPLDDDDDDDRLLGLEHAASTGPEYPPARLDLNGGSAQTTGFDTDSSNGAVLEPESNGSIFVNIGTERVPFSTAAASEAKKTLVAASSAEEGGLQIAASSPPRQQTVVLEQFEPSLGRALQLQPEVAVTAVASSPADVAAPSGLEALLADWGSLYAGVGGNIAKEALPSALYLGVYEACKTVLLKTSLGASLPLCVYLVAGGAGELCGSVLRAPAEAVKSLVQSNLATGFADAVQKIASTKKSRARVGRAWSASVIRDVPMGAIQICIFESLKLYILNSPSISIDVNTLGAEAALGALGGLIGAVVTTPMDVATTRIITSADDDDRDALAIMREIYQEGGPLALFGGAFQRGLYWAPAIGLFLSTYCSIRQYAASDPEACALVGRITHVVFGS